MKRKASFSTPEAKPSKLAKGRDKKIASGKPSLTKKDSSIEAEGGAATSVYPTRSSGSDRAKKKVPKTKPVVRKLRERIPEIKFMTGPLNNLEWSDWKLAISLRIYLRRNLVNRFKWSNVFCAYLRKKCFETAENIPAIYEVGVKYTYYQQKIHVMFFRVCRGTSKVKQLIPYILSNKYVRDEVNRLVRNDFDIYIRRGTSATGARSANSVNQIGSRNWPSGVPIGISGDMDKTKTMGAIKAAADHLNTIDYAWRKPISRKKRYRENVSEAELMTGPLKQLDWSEWHLAVSKHALTGNNYKKLQKSPILGACYLQRNLFENDKEQNRPAIYEVGVKYTYFKKKICVTYYRATIGVRANKRFLPSILNNMIVHDEVKRLINNNFDIYIRRGVSNEIFTVSQRRHIKTAAEHLDRFDYAWSPRGTRGPRQLMTD